jgi:very-short-patch-repair endonuclease
LAARQHAVVSRRQLLELVREAGLPLPVVNARIAGYEVDFHWPAARLIVETDGRETHDTPHQFEEDRRRDLALSLAGWRVVRLTWRQVTREPETVVALLRSQLASIL